MARWNYKVLSYSSIYNYCNGKYVITHWVSLLKLLGANWRTRYWASDACRRMDFNKRCGMSYHQQYFNLQGEDILSLRLANCDVSMIMKSRRSLTTLSNSCKRERWAHPRLCSQGSNLVVWVLLVVGNFRIRLDVWLHFINLMYWMEDISRSNIYLNEEYLLSAPEWIRKLITWHPRFPVLLTSHGGQYLLGS